MASSQSAEVHITYSSHVNSAYRSVQRRKVAWAAHISLPPNIMSQVSKACCSIPPVKTDYQPKGSMEKVAGFDSYVVGPADSKNVLVCVYDIFGSWDTTTQCADLLSESMKIKVVMPDFLRNKPWPITSFPPSNEEEQKKFQEWFSTVASVPDAKKDVEAVAQELKKNGAEKLGLYGLCWGGKITSLAGYEGTLFSGVAIVHPAMVNGEDSKGLTVLPGSVIEKKPAARSWAPGPAVPTPTLAPSTSILPSTVMVRVLLRALHERTRCFT